MHMIEVIVYRLDCQYVMLLITGLIICINIYFTQTFLLKVGSKNMVYCPQELLV